MQSTQKPVTSLVTPARTLRAAASHLERHGWIQHAYYDLTSTVFTPAACMVGAIAMVCYGGPVDCPAHLFDEPGFDEFEAALTVLDAYVSRRGLAPTAYDFNDAKGRTAEQVIHVLKDAADEWERWLPEATARLHDLLREASNVCLLRGGAA